MQNRVEDVEAGQLPAPTEQLPTGTGSHQKNDSDGQHTRLSKFAASKQLRVIEAGKEIGSGLKGHRRGKLRGVENPSLRRAIVEHGDRLMRFGIE